jgi:hypothetical protein
MDARAVLAKTPQGQAALTHRDHELPRPLRHVLILVDGRSTVAELEAKGAMIPDFADSLRELLARGLVAPRGRHDTGPPSGFPARGGRAGRVVRKLDEAGESREALAAAVEAGYKLIRLTIDEAQAEEFRRAARAILSRER